MTRRSFTSVLVAAVVATATTIAPASTESPDLENLEHVFNFSFPDATPDNAQDVNDMASDMEFYSHAGKDYAVVGSYDRGAYIFDITDPEATKFVSQVDCKQRQNDVQIKIFPATSSESERVVLVLAKDRGTAGNLCYEGRLLGNRPSTTDGAPGGIVVFDITDPAVPTPLYSYRYEYTYPLGQSPGFRGGGAHNFTWHPTAPVGWLSTGDLPGVVNRIPIFDFSDLHDPVLFEDVVVEGGPHDISFNGDGSRAYVAVENHGQIYDTTDPLRPVLISELVGPASYVHGLDTSPDGRLMVLTDESLVLGGFFADKSALCPGGGLTFYAIDGDNERSPKPLSYFRADVFGQSPDHRACTAHIGEISPNSKVMTVGWYLGGVRVLDLSDPTNPHEIGHAVMPGTEVWSAKIHKGPYVYASDLGRGFDVYRWTGPEEFGN